MRGWKKLGAPHSRMPNARHWLTIWCWKSLLSFSPPMSGMPSGGLLTVSQKRRSLATRSAGGLAGIGREGALVAALAGHAHKALVAFAEWCSDRPAGFAECAFKGGPRACRFEHGLAARQFGHVAVARHVAAEAHAGRGQRL